MILIKRGSCLLAVAVLAFNLCLPLAYATEGEETTVATRAALPALGWRDTVAAWLMTSGIYPTMTEDDPSFGGWADDRVVSLWNEFVDFVGDSTQATLEDLHNISSYLVDGVMTISKGKWGQLRSFTQFLRDKYALRDNQEGVQIGRIDDVVLIPSYSVAPTAQQLQDSGIVLASNFSDSSRVLYALMYPPVTGFTGTIVSVRDASGSYSNYYVLFEDQYGSNDYAVYYVSNTNGSFGSVSRGWNKNRYYDNAGNILFRYCRMGQHYQNLVGTGDFTDVPKFENEESAFIYFLDLINNGNPFSGITANTTVVNTPAALPETSDYGGIRIAGTGEAVTVEALQELIQEAVIEGLQPIISVVGVDLAPDININPDNGDITQDPIEITPDNIPMTQSDYMIPQLHTRFPFSIPWDVFNVLNALNAEPQRPYWDVSLTLPGLFGEDIQIPFTIGVKDDSPVAVPMDRTAAVIRAFVLVLLCVGTLLVVIRR